MEPTPEILRAIKLVRPLPNVAHRVLAIAQRTDWSLDEMVAVVRTEPTLVARILRLCNSARFGLETEVTSIADAISYLGSRNIVELVLMTCSAGMFEGVRGSTYADPKQLWHHAVACAVACQVVATRFGEVSPTTAFTVGILHDIGRIALSHAEAGSRLLMSLATGTTNPTDDLSALERRAFGLDHAAAAGLVADQWRLPAPMVLALRAHHDPATLSGKDPLPSVLHVAEGLVMQAGVGNPFPQLTMATAETACERLGFVPADLERLAATLATELARAAELLNLQHDLRR